MVVSAVASHHFHRLLKQIVKMEQQQKMKLSRGIIHLAPMVRGSELAFRMLARQHGNASLCYTPMLRDHDVLSVAANPDKFLSNALRIDAAGRTDQREETAYLMLQEAHQADIENLVVQLCGSDPAKLAEATTAVLDIYSNKNGMLPAGMDLNLGCPQECALRENFGAFLVEKNANAAISCIASMRKAIDMHTSKNNANSSNNSIPSLSAKIRLLKSGVDDTIEFVRKLQLAGVDYVSIHCRHRTDKHNGEPDWEAGGRIVAAFSSELPIILNGGVSTHQDAVTVMERTNCHGVMAATGYLRNHRQYEQSSESQSFEPQYLALEYLELAEKYPPPSYLYIQKHLRWIFRDTLQPENDPSFDEKNYKDWRVRLWTFLVRPYLRSIIQFRMFVALYIQLSGSDKLSTQLPQSIRHLVDEVTFGSVKRAGKTIGKGPRGSGLH